MSALSIAGMRIISGLLSNFKPSYLSLVKVWPIAR